MLGRLKSDIVCTKEGIEAGAVLQLGMDCNTTNKALQFATTCFDKGRTETTNWLLIRKGWNNGTCTLHLESLIEPQEITVPPKHRTKCQCSRHVGTWRTNIYSV
mmetsp:Transcript_115472/g.331440  ORF Transcript_115472/g.331440 Transcript_115472/m.331440 type:complete len:104 (+) Transcript_115472:1195-1506(+)